MYSNKTLISAFIIIAGIIIAGGYFAYSSQVDATIKLRYEEIAAINKLKVKQIIDWHNERIGDAHAILNSALIADALKGYIYHRDEVVKRKFLDWFEVLEKSYKYKEILLLDHNFNPILSSSDTSRYTDEHLLEYVDKEGRDNIYISHIHFDNLNNIHYTIKIDLSDDGTKLGSLLILVDPNDFLFSLIQKWPTPSKSAETLIIRQEGDSLLFLNKLRHFENTTRDFKLPLNMENLPAVRAIKGDTGMYRGVDYRGVNVLSDIGSIPGTNWFIVSKIDEDEIFAGIRKYLIGSVVIVILLITVSYLLFLHQFRSAKIASYKNELKLQRDKLRMSNLYATLSQINQAIVREQSRAELILKIPQIPVKFGNFAACVLALKVENEKIIKAEAFSGGIAYFHKILNDDSSYRINDLAVASIRENKIIIHNDLKNFEEPWMEYAVENSIRAAAAAPITFYGYTIGSIVLYSTEENSFYEHERKLLEEIASDISFSLEAIDKAEKHRIIENQIIENERRLATLFKNLPGIAYRCAFNREWTMEFMSDATLEITGYTPEEIINDELITYNDIIFPEDRDMVWEEVNKAVKNKSAFTIVYRIKPRNKKYRWVWERGSPVFDEKEKVLALEGFISDITEVKEAQDNIQKSEEYFRYLFHNNPLPMWIYDSSSYNFLDINDVAVKKYGYSKKDFLSMSIYDIHAAEERKKLERTLKNNLGYPNAGEWKHKLESGEIIDVLIISHEIEFEGKEAVLSVSIDITDRKKVEKALIVAKEKAESSEKMKTDFLAQMSHEIRTPVNVILSFSSLIKEEVYSDLDDDLKDSFSSIDHAGYRLIRTIDSILNMAQITSGAFDIKPGKLDIYTDILLPLKREFESLASAKGLEFMLDSSCENTLVNADHYSLTQIFANLLDNAIKYTEEGMIKVNVECDDDHVKVIVQDTGIGMSEEYLPNLFSAFSQEETGYSRRYEGTGLGLALVSNYCKMNNAEITVKSEKHEGTAFTVILKKI